MQKDSVHLDKPTETATDTRVEMPEPFAHISLHDDQLQEIAREVRDEILTFGLDDAVLKRGMERAIKEAVRFAKESAQQEPAVPEWALRSQIEISNDLRTQLEDAQRRIVASQSLDEKAVAALSEFRAVMQNEAIPAIVETMRKRAEAGAKISHLPLNMPAASNLGLAD